MQSVTKRVYTTDFILALLGYVLFVCQDTISKDLITRYHATQIVFFASLSALLTVVIYTQTKGAWHKIKNASFTVHFFRSLTMFLAMSCFIYSTFYLPLTTLYSIIFTIPLLITIGGAVFLNEKVSWRRYTATIIGFIGAIIAIDPFSSEFSKISLIAIFMPFFPAISYLIVRKYGRQESLFSFLIYGKLFMILFSSVIAFNFYKPMPVDDLMINLVAGVLRGVAIIFVINSARHLPSSIFASAQYIQIIAGGIIGYLVFRDIPSLNTYLGGVLIIGAGLYIILREAQLGVNIVTSTTRHPTIPIKKD
jgi:drug/metabolite transporter (DMT)-like permease|tara:strand:- start:2224 stop:3147 length:924 start_codon:yes stop_codon:yes gene_type:complete